jgi:WD40 repeat protein
LGNGLLGASLGFSLVFSNVGNEIAFVDKGDLVIADTSNWNIRKRLGPAFFPLAFSHTDRYLAATVCKIEQQQAIKIWDLKDSKQWSIPTPFKHNKSRFRWSWQLSPDESSVYMSAASLDHIRKYDLHSGKIISTIPAQGVHCFTLSATGRWLACVNEAECIQLWDTQSGELIRQTKPQDGTHFGISISSDESLLAATSTKQWTKIWSLPDLDLITTLNGHNSEVWSVNFGRDEQTLVTTGKERRVLFWDVPDLASLKRSTKQWQNIEFQNFPGATKRITSIEADNLIQIWKITSGSVQRDFQLPVSLREFYYNTDLSEDGSIAAKAGWGGIDLIHTQSGKIVKRLNLKSIGIPYAAIPSLSPNQRWIMCSANGKWQLIRTDPVELVQTFDPPNEMGGGYRPAFSPDGLTVVFASSDDSFHHWDLNAQKEIQVFTGHTWMPGDNKFSKDGSLLATASIDGTIRIWDVKSGVLHVPPLHGHVMGVQRVDFSPDGKVLISGGDDHTVRFWNVATGQEMLIIPGAHYSMLSDDGNTLVFYDYDSETIECIAIPTLEEIDRLDAFNTTHSAQ